MAVAAVLALGLSGCGSTVAQVSQSAVPVGPDQSLGTVPLPGTTQAPGGPAAPAPWQTPQAGVPTAVPPTGRQPRVVSPRRPAVGKPVEVGVTVLVSSQDGAARLGFGEFQTGDARAQVAAVVRYINAHGGLAGSPIVPVVYTVDGTTTQNYDQLYQEICDFWTQDHKVVAGIYFRPMSSMVLPACMQARGTPLIAVGQGNIGADAFSRWPLLTTPIWPSMERGYAQVVQRAAANGYFKPGAKVGLLRFETAAMKRTAEQEIKPALARLGMRVEREVAFSMPQNTADLSGISSQMSSAVLQFAAAGINEVVVEDFAALISALFLPSAAAGGYKPAHGYVLTSDSLPSYTAANAPEGQLDGAVGTGWSPSQAGVDVDTAQNPVAGSAAAKRCLAAMRAGEQDMTRATVRQNAFVYCDLFFFLQDAMNAGRGTSASSFLAGASALTSGFTSALTFGTQFGARRHDGPSMARDLYYDRGCSCFRYRGGNRAL